MKSKTAAGRGRDRRAELERELDALRAELAAPGDGGPDRDALRERAAAVRAELERIELAIELERQQDA